MASRAVDRMAQARVHRRLVAAPRRQQRAGRAYCPARPRAEKPAPKRGRRVNRPAARPYKNTFHRILLDLLLDPPNAGRVRTQLEAALNHEGCPRARRGKTP
jgi:hypothetical protein